MGKSKDIRQLGLDEIEQEIIANGEKKFRAKQIHEWLWKKSARSFNEMTNLSANLRDWLNQNFEINSLIVDNQQKSMDGTIKSAFKLYDGNVVEGVLIPAEERMTACVSSQVGCSLSCKFCATGYMDRMRNLTPGEIYDQVVEIDKQAREHFRYNLSNIVFMGMGEPLLNYKNVLEGINKITSPDGLNMSPKRITVSTAGIAKMIKKLADDQVRFNLALSLHAARDEKRNQIMSINETNNLEVLKKALRYFKENTDNRITFEYIVFHNFNDSLEDAQDLAKFASGLHPRINIIEYNPIREADFTNTTVDRLDQFADFLSKKGLRVTVRRSRGKDIDAACGQLANKSF